MDVSEWSFIKGSILISAGLVVARVLGFAFSLVLARVFNPADYGFVQYYIALAGVLAIATQPFVQHTLARYIGKYREDEEALHRIVTNSWVILALLTCLTMLVVVPVLSITGKFNIGVIVIFLCSSLFYAYWGISRGFQAPGKLITAYLGSNLMQILAVLLFFKVFHVHSTQVALLIYGLSYLIPLAALEILFPFPARFGVKYIEEKMSRALINFSIPIWLSHGGYVLYSTLDVLMLQYFSGNTVLGVYTLTRTLTMVFSFIPEGVSTLLMPRIASLTKDKHLGLLKNSVLVPLVVNIIGLLAFLLVVPWFIRLYFGKEYASSMGVTLVLSLGMIVSGAHSVVTAVLVGSGKAQYETISRFVAVAAAAGVGFWLIPSMNALGAAGAYLAGSSAALGTYGVIYSINYLKNRRVAV